VLLIGIDEAGYGPRLGPLCHGYCALRLNAVPGGGTPPDLWALLHPAVMKHPCFDGSIAIDDSKKIFGLGAGLQGLAKGVSAFLACLSGECPNEEDVRALYDRILPEEDRSALYEDAWGRWDSVLTQPPPPDEGEVLVKRGRKPKPHPLGEPPAVIPPLSEALARAGVSVLAVGSRAMSARRYNAVLANSDNKAEVNWMVISAILEKLLALAAPGEEVFAYIDRQGGRKFYTGKISHLFPGAMPWVESETPKKSTYRIEADGRVVRICFLVEADGEALPVALGSMAAKLARELCMRCLNGYFKSHMPELKPTAGYYGDASRFLRETKALRKKLAIENAVFVRKK